MNATGSGMYDVAIAGLGPAGRALASRCAGAGLRVLAVDPAPDAPWTQTISLWTDQLPPWLDPAVLAHTVGGPALYSPDRTVLDREYAVLDTARLREALPLDSGVTVEQATIDRTDALLARAHRVVDCRGAGRPDRSAPLQTAYGIVLAARDAAPALADDPALFMDWRTDYDDDECGPSFLYALPLGHDSVLLEETCLAGRPAPAPAALRDRLRSRLLRRGVSRACLDAPSSTEEVRIPLLPRSEAHPDPRLEAFGTAGGHGHAATGYSVAATLAALPAAVNALRTGYPLPAPRTRGTDLINRVGLRALLHAEERTLHQLFAAFGQLDGRRQHWFLDGTGPSYQVAAAMWQMWATMPVRGKAGMITAVAGWDGPRP